MASAGAEDLLQSMHRTVVPCTTQEQAQGNSCILLLIRRAEAEMTSGLPGRYWGAFRADAAGLFYVRDFQRRVGMIYY
jgi:hypothetical protein